MIKEGAAIRDMYPDYVEAGSVYEALAQAYTAKNDKAKAMEQLKRYSDDRRPRSGIAQAARRRCRSKPATSAPPRRRWSD